MKNYLLQIVALGLLIGLSACARNPEKFYFGAYSEAETLYRKGDYERAIQKYQAYTDENPEGNLAVISQYYIARSHASLGHKDEAVAIFQRIIKDHPETVWANFSETQLKQIESSAAPVKTS